MVLLKKMELLCNMAVKHPFQFSFPAIKSMVGSSGRQRQRVQTDVVANLSINLPPLETQQKIASLLSSLDDKIELRGCLISSKCHCRT